MSDQISESMSVEEIMARIRDRVRLRKQGDDGSTAPAEAPAAPSAQPERRLPLYDLSGLRHHSASSKTLASIIGAINPRPPGVHNTLIQLLKKSVRRLLTWYTRPLREFGDSVAHSLNEATSAIENLQANLDSVQNKLGDLENTTLQAMRTRLGELEGSQKSNLEAVRTRLGELEGSQKSNLEAVQQKLAEAQAESRKQMQNIRTETLSFADSGKGPKAAEGLWFNEPVMVHYEENGKASWGGTHERIIEKAWVLRQLARIPLGAKLLDIGCTESILSIELASSGFQVTGIDVRPYPLEHPNLMFVRADLCNSQLEPESYDVIIALSAIEHIGLGFYGDPVGKSSDKTAMREVYRLLKPGGQLLITVPFGVRAVLPLHRIYDRKLLYELLRRFKIEKIEYGVRLDDKTWVTPATKRKAAAQTHHPHTHLPSAVAMAVCTKPKKR